MEINLTVLSESYTIDSFFFFLSTIDLQYAFLHTNNEKSEKEIKESIHSPLQPKELNI